MQTLTFCYYCAGAFITLGTSASTYQMACDGVMNAMWTAGDVSSCADGG